MKNGSENKSAACLNYVIETAWSIEQIVGIKRNAEQTTLLDLFLAGMSSVMVTISTCAGPHIPTVIIKRISVHLHGAELRSCSYSNSLFVDYWQDTGTCQQHVRETASLSVESHHEGWHFPLYALPPSFFLALPLRGCPETTPSSLLTRDFLTVTKSNWDVFTPI